MANILDFGGVRALTSNAQPGAGYVAEFYVSGTTTPVIVYTDSTLGTAHGTSVTADSAGRFDAVWSSGGAVKCIIKDADGAVVQTIDPVLSVSGSVSNAEDVTFTPTVELPFTNVQDALAGSVAVAASGYAAFGLGITGNAGLLAALDATNIASGEYRFDGTTTGTYPTGVAAADLGFVAMDRQSATVGVMELHHATTNRVFRRRLTAGAWGAWRERIEVNIGATQGDMIVRGASDWERVAASAFQGRGFTWLSPQVTTSGTAFDFTGIPSWATEIAVAFSSVSVSGTDSIRVQIGDSGGFETSGYSGAQALSESSSISTSSLSATGFAVALASAGNDATGFMQLMRPFADNEWLSNANISRGAQYTWSSQSKTLSGVLTQVRVTRSSTDTFDLGRVSVGYR